MIDVFCGGGLSWDSCLLVLPSVGLFFSPDHLACSSKTIKAVLGSNRFVRSFFVFLFFLLLFRISLLPHPTKLMFRFCCIKWCSLMCSDRSTCKNYILRKKKLLAATVTIFISKTPAAAPQKVTWKEKKRQNCDWTEIYMVDIYR